MKQKRRKHNKITPKQDGNIYRILTHKSFLLDDSKPIYFIGNGCSGRNGAKDNRNTYNGGGHGDYMCRNDIRVPALNRSNKIWKNFYKLFPYIYFKMRKHSIGKKDGDIIEIDINQWQKAKVKIMSGLSVYASPVHNKFNPCYFMIKDEEIKNEISMGVISEVSDKNKII